MTPEQYDDLIDVLLTAFSVADAYGTEPLCERLVEWVRILTDERTKAAPHGTPPPHDTDRPPCLAGKAGHLPGRP